MLSPVITYCLRNSIKLQDVVESAKIAFIRCAEAELKRGSLDASVSRLSVMTGVHRRDVTRLFKENLPKESTNIITRVIGQWQEDKRFCSSSGKPRVLEVEGDPSEFTELIRSVSTDLNPYTVLYELERLGMVEREEDGGVKLTSGMFMPKGDLKQGMLFLANDTVELMSAIEENLAGMQEMPNYHIKTEYDNVAQDSLPVIRAWFLKQGSAFHKKARDFLSKHDKDINPSLKDKEGGARVVLGGFSRVEVKRNSIA